MNRDDEIRARFDAYTDAINDPNVDSEPYWAVFRDNAYADIEDLLDETARLRAELELEKQCFDSQGYEYNKLTADLAAMTAERDALSSRVAYECAAKNAFDVRWLVENRKYNKSVVHLQRARGQRDALKAELHRAQKEVDKLPIYEAANAGLHDKLCAAAAERDAMRERVRDVEDDLKMVCTSGEPCAACSHCADQGPNFPCRICDEWCGVEKWEWRGPVAGNQPWHFS